MRVRGPWRPRGGAGGPAVVGVGPESPTPWGRRACWAGGWVRARGGRGMQ